MPNDLRAAIHDVWENLDPPHVKRPVMLLLTEDGVEEPGVVNHFGQVGLVHDLNTNSYVLWSPGAHYEAVPLVGFLCWIHNHPISTLN